MGDLRLPLKDGAQELGQVGVDRNDLLELVHDQGDAMATRPTQLGGQFEQPLERRVDISRSLGHAEAEGERAIVGVDVDRRLNLQPTKRSEGALAHPLDGGGDLLVDRSREGGGEALLAGRRHQVDLDDEYALRGEGARCPPNERGLAKATGSEDDHVLSVADVVRELAQLRFTVGKSLVEREGAKAEGVGCVYQLHILISIMPFGIWTLGRSTALNTFRYNTAWY